MNKIIAAIAAVSSISLVASAAVAAPTATLVFDAKQTVQVNGCNMGGSVPVTKISSTKYTIHVAGLPVSGPHPACSLLYFINDFDVNFSSDPTLGSSTTTLSGIKLYTVSGECDQAAGTPLPGNVPTPPTGTSTYSSPPPKINANASGWVYGFVYGPPVTQVDCTMIGSIEITL